jgi:hypothetical protein
LKRIIRPSFLLSFYLFYYYFFSLVFFRCELFFSFFLLFFFFFFFFLFSFFFLFFFSFFLFFFFFFVFIIFFPLISIEETDQRKQLEIRRQIETYLQKVEGYKLRQRREEEEEEKQMRWPNASEGAQSMAAQLITMAVDFDRKDLKAESLVFYEASFHYFERALRFCQNPTMQATLNEKYQLYRARVEQLKVPTQVSSITLPTPTSSFSSFSSSTTPSPSPITTHPTIPSLSPSPSFPPHSSFSPPASSGLPSSSSLTRSSSASSSLAHSSSLTSSTAPLARTPSMGERASSLTPVALEQIRASLEALERSESQDQEILQSKTLQFQNLPKCQPAVTMLADVSTRLVADLNRIIADLAQKKRLLTPEFFRAYSHDFSYLRMLLERAEQSDAWIVASTQFLQRNSWPQHCQTLEEELKKLSDERSFLQYQLQYEARSSTELAPLLDKTSSLLRNHLSLSEQYQLPTLLLQRAQLGLAFYQNLSRFVESLQAKLPATR